MKVSGQEFTDEIVALTQAAAASDGMTRGRLSRMVSSWLGWRHKDGRLKEMNCRAALLKLERRGAIKLPKPKPADFSPDYSLEVVEWLTIETSLSELTNLDLVLVDGRDKRLSRIWRQMMRQNHPLSDGPLCGAQLRYLVRCNDGWLGGLSFSAAAWRLKERDTWIGWDDEERSRGLEKIVCNSRFLIIPTVKVPHLASCVLGMALRRLPLDWRKRYDHEPVLVETFVDPSRWRGTCYKAANFIEIGLTSGRGRQGRRGGTQLEPKRILAYPLRPDWQTMLCSGRGTVQAAKTVVNLPVIDWAQEEFGKSSFNDVRLTERLMMLARDFYAKPTGTLPQTCGSRAKTKAAYRFFDHEVTNLQSILQPHYLATELRIQREAVVLAVQDTTTVNYTGLEETEGLGPIGDTADGPQGLILHDTLTFSTSGVPLGLLDAQCWVRDPEQFGKEFRKKREKMPIETKESFKWLKSYRAVADVQARNPNVMLVSVGDREADIYELFDEAINKNPEGPKLLVRAQHNRRVNHEVSYLWEMLEGQPLAGIQILQIPRAKNRQQRDANLELRFAKVSLKVPFDKKKARGGKELKDIEVWAILAQEKDRTSKDALEWLLLTTLPVKNFEEAIEKLAWYTKRWGIEIFHKILKSGCGIERRQLCTAERLETCLAIDMVVGWRIYHMTHLARVSPNTSCESAFSEGEWKSLVAYTTRKPPIKPPTMRESVRMVAELGGFLGRKCDGEPGPQTIWRGLERLSDIAKVYEALRANPSLLGVPQTHVSRQDYG